MTRAVARRPVSTLWAIGIISVLFLGISVRFLEFKTKRSDLIDPRADFQQRWLHYTERFGDESEIVVAIAAEDRDRVIAVTDEIGREVSGRPDLFDHVFYRVDPGPLIGKGLQFLSPQQLEAGLQRLSTYGPILDGHWDRAGLESYCQRLIQHIRACESSGATEEYAATVDQAARLCRSLAAFSTNPEAFESPWPEILTTGDAPRLAPETQYLTNDRGTMAFIMAMPIQSVQDFSGTSPSLAAVRSIVTSAQERHPDVKVLLTGIPVLESDEMRRSQSDMTLASVISFIGVAILMFAGFRGFWHPVLALSILGVGLVWSMGFTTLAIGHLNILSVSFAAMLIGVGTDFAICYLTRYLELRHENVELRPALIRTSAGVGTGIITAAVTAALSFWCTTLTDFLGLAELGVIAAVGVLICAAITFLMLPALLTLSDRRMDPQRLPTPFQGTWLRVLTSRHPWAVAIASSVVVLAIGCCGLEIREGRLTTRVRYDSNLLNLQPAGLDSVDAQREIFDKSDGSLLYAVSMARSASEARRYREEYLALPTVGRVEELASRMPAYPSAETQLLVQGFQARLASLASVPRELPRLDPRTIGLALEDLHALLGSISHPAAPGAATALDGFLGQLETIPTAGQVQLLSGYQYAMLTALRTQFEAIAAVSDAHPVSPDDFPSALRNRFLSAEGDWLVRIYPKEPVWDEAPLARFVAEVRSVDPDATGTPLQNFEAARQIRDSYVDAAICAFAVILLTVLIDSLPVRPRMVALLVPLVVVGLAVINPPGAGRSLNSLWLICLYVSLAAVVGAILDFRNCCNALLSMLPPLAGCFLMFGILGMFDIPLNPANLVVLPLILGTGIDSGIHIVHDFRSQQGRYRTSASTINAITLISFTSIIGFGSMLVSAHRGLASLGLVLSIGLTACLFVALVFLPALLTIVSQTRRPRTLRIESQPAAAAGIEAPPVLRPPLTLYGGTDLPDVDPAPAALEDRAAPTQRAG